MKKALIVFFVFLLVLPVFSFADPGVVLCYRMNLYAAAYNELSPGSFPFDTMMVDLYLMDDFKTAYYCKTTWADGSIETTGYIKCEVSKKDVNSKYHLYFPNGETMQFYYEDKNLWLEMENGTWHLLPCERFDIKTDLRSFSESVVEDVIS